MHMCVSVYVCMLVYIYVEVWVCICMLGHIHVEGSVYTCVSIHEYVLMYLYGGVGKGQRSTSGIHFQVALAFCF